MKRLPLAALLALLLIPGSAVAQHHGGSHPRKKASGTGVRCGNGYISSSDTCHKGESGSTSDDAPKQDEPTSSYDGEQRRADSETVAAEREAREHGVVTRDAEGHIMRSEAARRLFMAQSGFPDGRPGYVVDHIKPLACGGADDPSNMQWQTDEEAKAKDKVERVGCHP